MQGAGVADAWFNWRNRLLAGDGFRRLAAAFAPTRWIARRRAAEVFDLVAGFVYSQVLLACVRLGLFEILAEGPQQLEILAPRVGLTPAATERLLSAAVALRLAERRPGQRYGLGTLGAPMVGNHALAALVEHHSALYADLADPVALLRGNAGSAHLSKYWPYAGGDRGAAEQDVARYSALMSASLPLVADEILDAYPMRHHRRLLDIGGGEGGFLARVAEHAPELELVLFDLPAVAERAQVRLEQRGLAQRCRTVGGSFATDALPGGADIATLVRVVHDHDDGVVRQLLLSVRRALVPGGTLLLAEPMARTHGAEAMGDAYFGMYLWAMGSGRPRSRSALTELLRDAGFESIRPLPTRLPLQTSILVARTPITSNSAAAMCKY